jgi:hypothetical protein
MPSSMDDTNSAPQPPRGLSLRLTVVLVVVLLVGVPIALGATVGWYGINPPAAERLSPVGSEAHELLNSFPASSLVVEVDFQAGWAPPASAVSTLLDRINETCQKSSVTVESKVISAGPGPFTDSDLLALETAQRQTWPSWSTMSLYYLVLGGGYATDSSTIGLAYRGSSIAIFAGTIMADDPSEYDAVMATVLVHEFGHELGLVGIDGSAPNEDPNPPYHSNDPSDVMYWAVDSSALFGLFGSAPPNQFNAADLQDLSTVRSTLLLGEVLPWVVLGVLLGAGACVLGYTLLRRRRARRASEQP